MTTNPFAADEVAEHLNEAVGVVFNGAVITSDTHPGITTAWITASVATMAHIDGAPESGVRAVLWELARFVADVFEVEEFGQPDCGHPACHEKAHYEIAFLEAAQRGDIESAMNVAAALAKGAPTNQVANLVGFTASVVESLVANLLESKHR